MHEVRGDKQPPRDTLMRADEGDTGSVSLNTCVSVCSTPLQLDLCCFGVESNEQLPRAMTRAMRNGVFWADWLTQAIIMLSMSRTRQERMCQKG